MDNILLPLTTFFPLIGAVLLAFVPKKQHDTIKGVALIISFITLLLSLWIYFRFDPIASGMQLQVNIPWITSLGIHFFMVSMVSRCCLSS